MFLALSRQIRSPRRHPQSLRSMLALWRSRRALAALDPKQLEDVGISPAEARLEARKPVWDAPASWKC